MSRLYIIGNGFDLLHKLPTKFDPDFKNIAEKNEVISQFWSLYSSYGDEIWSDFENILGKPDFNSLEEIFGNYYPNYMSDYESDRDGIISVAEESGKLEQSLEEFAIQAEKSIDQSTSITGDEAKGIMTVLIRGQCIKQTQFGFQKTGRLNQFIAWGYETGVMQSIKNYL